MTEPQGDTTKALADVNASLNASQAAKVAADAKIATPAHKPTHNVTANDHEAIIIARMETEGNIIANSLCGSFQFKHHGTNKQADVQNILNRQPKTFQYDIKSDGTGKFIEIKNGALVVRVPKDETQYLPIS